MRRGNRRRRRDRRVDGAIAVEVAHGGQHRPAALGRSEQRGRQWRSVGEPAVVERVGAVVERDGSSGQGVCAETFWADLGGPTRQRQAQNKASLVTSLLGWQKSKAFPPGMRGAES